MTTTNPYWIQVQTIPSRSREPKRHRAIVYRGPAGNAVAVAATEAYATNAGTGIAAAIKDAQHIIDARLANDFFSLKFTPDLTDHVIELTGNGERKMTDVVKEYLTEYVVWLVLAAAIAGAVMQKGC
jgi:hypothetical protein